jgi:hypothetical protein
VTAEFEADLWPAERLAELTKALERLGAQKPTGGVEPPRLLRQRQVLALSFLLDVASSREARSQGEKLIEEALKGPAIGVPTGTWRVVSLMFGNPKPVEAAS